MSLYLVAYFFGGVFAANSVPHFVAGVSGRPMQTPFASPPFRGLSSPVVNVAWACFNLALVYVLVLHVGDFAVRSFQHAGVCFAGFVLMALQCARSFGKLNKS